MALLLSAWAYLTVTISIWRTFVSSTETIINTCKTIREVNKSLNLHMIFFFKKILFSNELIKMKNLQLL